MRDYVTFLFRVWRLSWQGSWKFYAWMTLLSVVSLVALVVHEEPGVAVAQPEHVGGQGGHRRHGLGAGLNRGVEVRSACHV